MQLPLYNEQNVAGRLIDAVARLQWPSKSLEIQVLDDSTDETVRIVADRVAYWRNRGRRVLHIRRPSRDGFKAGALANGLKRSRGEFIAVFDADFIPPRDFLHNTIPVFQDPEIGMVQTRWAFLNASHSWLTRIQAVLLEPHFAVEHAVRYHKGLFFNFNGTAGVWRKTAIVSAGGWLADTVTEDLDISYRAQMAGWRFVYRDDIHVLSELPPSLAAFRAQQQRWAKGSIQTARKQLPGLLKSRLPLRIKIEATAHLLANLGWLCGALATLTLYPTLLERSGIGLKQILWVDVPLFLMTCFAVLLYYFCFLLSEKGGTAVLRLPAVLATTIGLAPSIALAVISGVFRDGGYFARTPKYGNTARHLLPGAIRLSLTRKILPYLFINTAFLIYTHFPVYSAWERGAWSALPLLVIFPIGFLMLLPSDIYDLLAHRGHSSASTASASRNGRSI